MLGRVALGLALAALAHGLNVQTVQAQTCAAQTKPNCLNHVANALNCNYNFTSNVCAPAPTSDACQSKTTASACAGAGCYYDSSIANCLKSLSQINSVYNCTYWTAQNSCQSHGCAYDVTQTPVCNDVTRQGSNFDNNTSSVISNKVNFSTPLVNANLIFTVNISVPFVYSSSLRLSPRFPVIQILTPQPGSSGPGALRNSSEQVTTCSSFQTEAYAEPIPNLASGLSDAAFESMIESSIAATGVITPYTSANRALLLAQFGNPRNDSLIQKVSYDTPTKSILYQLSINLTQAVQNCGARGFSVVSTSTGVVYSLPLSYVEHGVTGQFVQTSRLFTISITTTGQISIGATAQYHIQSTNIEVTYPQATCAAGEALQQISQTVVISDVFDPNIVVSPVSIGGLFVRPPGTPAGPPPINCYQDAITQYTFIGCNRQSFQCSYSFTTRSNCRVLSTDGNAFSSCLGAKTFDRLNDFAGFNNAYPTSLDGLHRVFVRHQACNGGVCNITAQAALSTLDEIRTVVQTPVFSATSLSANPFQVQGGFLPVPTADSTQFRQLTDQPGTNSNVSTFDGNVFSRQPITIAVFMPAALRADYDLRLLINSGNTTIFPLDTNGLRVTTSVPAFLDFSDIGNALLYTTKNALLQCAAGDVCANIPACSGILGCDGFSIPVAQLQALMPANGYGFAASYRVGLPGVPQTGALVSRRLLQTAEPQATDGNVYFRIRVNADGSITVEEVTVTPHKQDATPLFFLSLLYVALPALVLYLFVARTQLSCMSIKYSRVHSGR